MGIDDEEVVDFYFFGLELVDFDTEAEGAFEVNTVGTSLGSEEEGVLDGNTVVIGLGLYCTKGTKARLKFGGSDGGGLVC